LQNASFAVSRVSKSPRNAVPFSVEGGEAVERGRQFFGTALANDLMSTSLEYRSALERRVSIMKIANYVLAVILGLTLAAVAGCEKNEPSSQTGTPATGTTNSSTNLPVPP
jgi:hypothetical protein